MNKLFTKLLLNVFIKNRGLIGHKKQEIQNNYLMNYFVIVEYFSIVYNFNKIKYFLKFIYLNLNFLFFFRSKCLITLMHKKISLFYLNNFLEYQKQKWILLESYQKRINIILNKWTLGLISNWKNIWSLFKVIEEKLEEKKWMNRKWRYHYKILFDFILKNKFPNIPDFIFLLNFNKNLFVELKKEKIFTWGVVDTNYDSSLPVFNILLSDDSIEIIFLFFFLINESIKEGYFLEQKLFYKYFIKNIYNYL